MGKRQKVIIYILLAFLLVVLIVLVAVKYREKILSINRVVVYFVDYDENLQKPYMVTVTRTISPVADVEERIRKAIEELLKGPTQDEIEKGIISVMPQKASLLNVYIEDETVYLDFSKEIEEGGGSLLMLERLAQIVFTATQFDSVKSVRLQIEGSFIEYFSGEGITDVADPMTRDNFKEFIR